VRKLTQIYVCRKCKRKYSQEDFSKSRFCLSCGTYLIARIVVSSRLRRRIEAPVEAPKTVVENRASEDQWLPRGYEKREGQVKFIEEATKALEDNKVFLGSAPCGIGKSLGSILSVLPLLGENKLLISFRTRSQLHIFLKELRALEQNPLAVSFFSKQDMCPLLRAKSGVSYLDFLEECRRLKENCETATKPYCRYYWNLLRRKRQADEVALDCARKILDPSQAAFRMAKRDFCAYEALKRVLSQVRIFLGTYNYTFNKPVRDALLQSWGVDLSNVYLIVDEAHNLPTFARELLSDRITQNTIESAMKETENFEHENLPDVKDYLSLLDNHIFQRARKRLRKENLMTLDPQQIDELFLEVSGTSGLEAAETLHEYGEYVREKRQELGNEKIFSYNHRVGEFVENFLQKAGKKYAHLIERGWRDNIGLEVKSLDGREITDPVLREARGSIVMSGFLSPPKVYRDLILRSQADVHLKEFDSPFPPENRLILAARDVSSSFEKRTDGMLQKWGRYIAGVSEANEGNMGVFFTSYNLMNTVISNIQTDRRVIVEERKTRRSTVMEKLTASNHNVLFGVMGGKFSEGMDYPDNLLTCVVTVGLPYATWSIYQKALIDYYNIQFPGRGRVYAYLTPAIYRLVQACGRVHRSATDKGCIVILDERVTRPDIKQLLSTYYQKEMKTVKNPMECGEHIENFWRKHRGLV
jgi:DNA excision repair protein ERCC-2